MMSEPAEHTSEEEARSELGSARTRPPWLASDHSLPFKSLTSDEFEVLSFLLLRRERSGTARVTYFGKTGDLGRDILITSGNERELVQCKHYPNGLRIGAVRMELAKLFVNVFAKAIQQPDKVVFYASSDLSSPATDLLQSQPEWAKQAAKALEDHTGELPSPGLIGFATTWWPSVSHVTGFELTERLRPYPDLIEEFFSQRPVITGDVSDVFARQDVQDRKLDLVLACLGKNATATLGKMLAQAEASNPGLAFTATTTPGGQTEFSVTIKKDHGPIQVGKLSFRGGPRGAQGAEKFKRAMEEGRAVELEEGEFQWSSGISVPGRAEAITTKIAITPSLPSVNAPVRLDCMRGADTLAVLDFTYLVPRRLGLLEMEFEVKGGRLAGSLVLVVRHATGAEHSITISTDLGSLPAAQAANTVRFLEALGEEGASLRVISLEFDGPVLAMDGFQGVKLEHLKSTRELLLDLATISAEFGVDVRFPNGELSPDVAMQVKLLASAILRGGATIRMPNDIFAVDAAEVPAVSLKAALKTKMPGVSFGPQESVFALFGHSLPAGPVTIHVLDPEWVESEPEIPDLPNPGSTAAYRLTLRCSGVTYEFTKWAARRPEKAN